jgi:ABC-type nickel/cobalt efflux system permease component RcnA
MKNADWISEPARYFRFFSGFLVGLTIEWNCQVAVEYKSNATKTSNFKSKTTDFKPFFSLKGLFIIVYMAFFSLLEAFNEKG